MGGTVFSFLSSLALLMEFVLFMAPHFQLERRLEPRR
jgi:hypothetical protein